MNNALIYGFDRELLETNCQAVLSRLYDILYDKVMRFNPYRVDDATLLACADRGYVRPLPTLTQMCIFRFSELRTIKIGDHTYEALHYKLGNDPCERHIPVGKLLRKICYRATCHDIRSTVNGAGITNISMIEKMQNRSYFLSHTFPGMRLDKQDFTMNLWRLKGDVALQASDIRRHMCSAKIKILTEVLNYPHCRHYLRCQRYLFDYTTPIQQAIRAIKQFSSTQ